MNITLDQALTKVPTRDEMWQVVREARDYLSWYINTPDGLRVDPNYGEVVFDSSVWGRKITSRSGGCFVCLAGLWYLKKLGVLLGEVRQAERLSPIADCLDDMRYAGPSYGSRVLGIEVPDYLGNTLLAGTIDEDNDYDEDNPAHVLLYLDWLLQQHDTPTADTHER